MPKGWAPATIGMLFVYAIGFEFLERGEWLSLRTLVGFEGISINDFLFLAGGATALAAWGMYCLVLRLGRPKKKQV